MSGLRSPRHRDFRRFEDVAEHCFHELSILSVRAEPVFDGSLRSGAVAGQRGLACVALRSTVWSAPYHPLSRSALPDLVKPAGNLARRLGRNAPEIRNLGPAHARNMVDCVVTPGQTLPVRRPCVHARRSRQPLPQPVYTAATQDFRRPFPPTQGLCVSLSN